MIEQQMAILTCLSMSEQTSNYDTQLLMEADSSQSLIAIQKDSPSPSSLYRYLDENIAGFATLSSTDSEKLYNICRTTSFQAERLVERWTSLPEFDDRLRDAEREARKQKQETQQPTVESDSEDDHVNRGKLAGNYVRKMPQRSGSVEPLFTDAKSIPIPVPTPQYGPTAPLSPAVSPRTSRNSILPTPDKQHSPITPRTSMGRLPVEAAAAMEAKDEDDDVDLEIPWTLCTRKFYWKYVDSKQVASNTDPNPSLAFLDRNSWTEIMASWVCKEAIKEAGHSFTQFQKDMKDGRRTKFETCFCIERPLQFDQVKLLVERTVEIYRKTAAPTPPPQVRRPSIHRPPPPPVSISKASEFDRGRTPIVRNAHPPLERTTSSMLSSTPMPSPLDRSLSMPGPGLAPLFRQQQQQQQPGPQPYTSTLKIPMPLQGYVVQPAPGPQTLQTMAHVSQAGSYLPRAPNQDPLPSKYPPGTKQNLTIPKSASKPLPLQAQCRGKYDDVTTSDVESGERERSRKHRSKSRNRYSSGQKKKSHGTSRAVGALIGVGGLTALLDGLSGL